MIDYKSAYQSIQTNAIHNQLDNNTRYFSFLLPPRNDPKREAWIQSIFVDLMALNKDRAKILAGFKNSKLVKHITRNQLRSARNLCKDPTPVNLLGFLLERGTKTKINLYLSQLEDQLGEEKVEQIVQKTLASASDKAKQTAEKTYLYVYRCKTSD